MKWKNFFVILVFVAVSSCARIPRELSLSTSSPYEYYLPTDLDEINDEKLKNYGVLSKNDDNDWVLTMEADKGNLDSDIYIYLYMPESDSLEFTLDVGSEEYPKTLSAEISFDLYHPDGTSKSLTLYVSKTKLLEFKISEAGDEGDTLLAKRSASSPKRVKITINHDGFIKADSDSSYQSQMSLTGAGVFKMNALQWKDLPRDFKIIIPSKIFRSQRLITTTENAGNNGTTFNPETAEAGLELWHWVIIVAGVLIVIGLIGAVGYVIYRKFFKKADSLKDADVKTAKPQYPETYEPLAGNAVPPPPPKDKEASGTKTETTKK